VNACRIEILPINAIKTINKQKDIVLNDAFLTELCRTAITETFRLLKLPVSAFNIQSHCSDVTGRCHQMLTLV